MIIYNTFLLTLKEISKDNKYTLRYCFIVEAALNRAKTKKNAKIITKQIIERHHILPKCLKLGGEKDFNNYVFLTAREHFICHKLLLKMFDGHFHHKMNEGLAIFFNNTNRKLKLTSRDYDLLKKANSEAAKIRNKGNTNYKQRKPYSESQRITNQNRNMNSKWINDGTKELFTIDHVTLVNHYNFRYGRLPFSKEWNEKISRNLSTQALLGVPKSEKHKQAMRKPKKSGTGEKIRIRIQNEQKITCIHCSKTLDPRNYKKWHGDKCKNR